MALPVDRQPKVRLNQFGEQAYMDSILEARLRNYTIFVGDHMVQLQCLAMAGPHEPDLANVRFESVIPLCDQIAGSVVFRF